MFVPGKYVKPSLMFASKKGAYTRGEHLKGASLGMAQAMYCIEGTEMRQLGFTVRRLLFLNRY